MENFLIGFAVTGLALMIGWRTLFLGWVVLSGDNDPDGTNLAVFFAGELGVLIPFMDWFSQVPKARMEKV